MKRAIAIILGIIAGSIAYAIIPVPVASIIVGLLVVGAAWVF